MQHARLNKLRHVLTCAALAALLGVVSLVLSQCTMVSDNVTGVDLAKGRPTTCIKQCNDLYVQIYDQEQKAHDQAKALCDMAWDTCDAAAQTREEHAACVDARQACQAAESARHEAAKDEITQGKIDCQEGCSHQQGTGSAG